MTAELPEGWATIRVGDYFDSWGGMTPSTSNASYWGGNVPWVSSKDIKAWRITGAEDFITHKALEATRLRLCPVGSVLVVVRSGILAHTLPVAVVDTPVSINQDLKAFYSPDGDINEWLALSLHALASEILTNNRKDGTTVQSVRYEQLLDLEIPVPPSNEQRRITVRLGELLGKVAKTRDHLSRVPAILKRFRQAVLAAACSGRLTEDWRESSMDDEADAETLPIQVANRRLDWFTRQKNNREAKRTQQKIEALSIEPPPEHELPQNWTWSTLLESCWMVVDCHNKTAPYQDDGIPLVRTSNVRGGRLLLDEVKHVSEATYQFWSRRCPPAPGDVLLTREAPMGECVVIPPGVKLCMGQRMMLLRTFRELLSSDYLAFAMQDPRFQSRMSENAVGSGVKHLRVGDVERLWIPIPPITEQHEIVRRVKTLLSLADDVETRCNTAQSMTESMTQSILAKGFRGELVPTEAELARREGRDYEPASVFLERIKEQRDRESASKNSKPKRNRKSSVATARA